MTYILSNFPIFLWYSAVFLLKSYYNLHISMLDMVMVKFALIVLGSFMNQHREKGTLGIIYVP